MITGLCLLGTIAIHLISHPKPDNLTITVTNHYDSKIIRICTCKYTASRVNICLRGTHLFVNSKAEIILTIVVHQLAKDKLVIVISNQSQLTICTCSTVVIHLNHLVDIVISAQSLSIARPAQLLMSHSML